MSSSTSNSRRLQRWLPLLTACGLLVLVNLPVPYLSWRGARAGMEEGIATASCFTGRDVPILILGDSKVGRFGVVGKFCPFFADPAFVFGYDSATILYHRLQYRRLLDETGYRPEVVFISLGANNFNENGLHIRRDSGVRTVARPGEILSWRSVPGGWGFLLDGLFCRGFPIYGYRIEITHLRLDWHDPIRRQREVTMSTADVPDRSSMPSVRFETVRRSEILDRNYMLIYRRSVYADYVFSWFHLEMLRQLVGDVRSHGGKVVLVQLPVERAILELESRMVGDRYDRAMDAFVRSTGVGFLDLRKRTEYEFRDINHLSDRGAYDLCVEVLDPVVRSVLGSG